MHGKCELGVDSFIGDFCVLGAPTAETLEKGAESKGCVVGIKSVLRQFNVVYENVELGDHVQTGAFVQIRENTKIESYCRIQAHCCIQWDTKICRRSRLAPHVIVGEKTILGPDTFLGPYVVTATDKKMDAKQEPILLDRGVRVGSHTVILGGVKIGVGSLIGACSLVNRDVPAWSVAFGKPAKVVRRVTEDEISAYEDSLRIRFGDIRPRLIDLYTGAVNDAD